MTGSQVKAMLSSSYNVCFVCWLTSLVKNFYIANLFGKHVGLQIFCQVSTEALVELPSFKEEATFEPSCTVEFCATRGILRAPFILQLDKIFTLLLHF